MNISQIDRDLLSYPEAVNRLKGRVGVDGWFAVNDPRAYCDQRWLVEQALIARVAARQDALIQHAVGEEQTLVFKGEEILECYCMIAGSATADRARFVEGCYAMEARAQFREPPFMTIERYLGRAGKS